MDGDHPAPSSKPLLKREAAHRQEPGRARVRLMKPELRKEEVSAATQTEARPSAVNEVELVLLLVEVRPRLDPGREHPSIRAEGRDPDPRPNLADDPVAELVQRRKCVTHGR